MSWARSCSASRTCIRTRSSRLHLPTDCREEGIQPGAAIFGGLDTVGQKLREFIAQTEADEIMIATDVYHHADRLRSYEVVAVCSAARALLQIS
jgi:alkanesulfonate monooxygenase SsuD/methylene tetrahydromethanopterin reductase-like flavin-dependent oxidoreductase (luciferase family)